MSQSRLDWNKNNIDIATHRIADMMCSDKDDRELYGIIRAILWAIGYILEWIKKHDERRNND